MSLKTRIEDMISINNYDIDFCLHWACRYNYLKIFKQLIELYTGDLHAHFFNACAEGHIEIVKILLDKGIENTPPTAIYYAYKRNQFKVVSLLIKNGYDISIIKRDKNRFHCYMKYILTKVIKNKMNKRLYYDFIHKLNLNDDIIFIIYKYI